VNGVLLKCRKSSALFKQGHEKPLVQEEKQSDRRSILLFAGVEP
jgi:hypothetical protein